MGIQHCLGKNADMIVQIVNCKGVMAGGVAKGIADEYPIVKDQYVRHCQQLRSSAMGTLQVVEVSVPSEPNKKFYVANLFAIDEPNFNWYKEKDSTPRRVVSYPALGNALNQLAMYIHRLKCYPATFVVMIPTGMGELRGGADWNIVKEHVDYHLHFTDLMYYEADNVR